MFVRLTLIVHLTDFFCFSTLGEINSNEPGLAIGAHRRDGDFLQKFEKSKEVSMRGPQYAKDSVIESSSEEEAVVSLKHQKSSKRRSMLETESESSSAKEEIAIPKSQKASRKTKEMNWPKWSTRSQPSSDNESVTIMPKKAPEETQRLSVLDG